MHFRPNHLLRTFLLSASAFPMSQALMGQEPGPIEYVAAPRWGEVQNVSGSRDPLTLLIANALPQPPALAKPPATSGPIPLPSRDPFPSDRKQDVNQEADRAKQDQEKSDDESDKSGKSEETNSKENENALTPLQNRKLAISVQVVDLSVTGLGTGSLPESAADEREKLPFNSRSGAFKCVHWHPSSICHYPLRFEEPMLERHGHVRFGCWQPLASGAKFFATIPMLPYLATLRPSCEPVYALGNYRPGSCAPLLRETIPYDKQAAVVEALSLAGFFWAMPL